MAAHQVLVRRLVRPLILRSIVVEVLLCTVSQSPSSVLVTVTKSLPIMTPAIPGTPNSFAASGDLMSASSRFVKLTAPFERSSRLTEYFNVFGFGVNSSET